jgi:hypothetical protein
MPPPEIKFGTQAELRRQRELSFLSKTPSERFQLFLQMLDELQVFSYTVNKPGKNFILEKSPKP